MARELIAAYTKPGADYPGYVNVSRDDGGVVLTVRGDPKVVRDGSYVCGFKADRGKPGRCTPGDERCNNYCNMAPEKGPMAPHPGAFTGVRGEGDTVGVRLTEAEWAGLLGEIRS